MTRRPFAQFNRIILILQSGWEMTGLAWKSHPSFFLGVVLIELFQGLMPVLAAWIMKKVFDLLAMQWRAEVQEIQWGQLLLLLFVQATINLMGQLLQPVSGHLNSSLNLKLLLNVQSIVYEKINSLSGLAQFENPKLYNLVNLAIQGAQLGPQQMINMLTSFTKSVTMFVSFMWALIAFDPLLAFAVAVSVLPQVIFQLKFGQQRFQVAKSNSTKEQQAGYFGYVLSSLSFAKELRLYGLADFFLKSYRQLTEEINSAKQSQELHEIRWQMTLNILSGLVASGSLIFIILRAFVGIITLGSVSFYANAVNGIQGASLGIIYSFSSLYESSLFYSQFKDLIVLSQTESVPEAGGIVSPLSLGIEFRNVSFRYGDHDPWVLRNINLKIPAGHCLALVGLNGSGKTTIVKLLTRLYDPVEGQILWDGVDICTFNPKDLRDRMAVILQDFIHYDLTAYENIALGNLAQFDDVNRVGQSAIQAGIDHIINALPQGYQTILSRWLGKDDEGIDLSGGEWQKIALARMLMRNANLLILDEPTAALDVMSECDLYSQFTNLMEGRTSVLISHRFSSVRMADKIAVLQDGKIIEYGSHTELMELAGEYMKLYKIQAEMYVSYS